MILLRNMRKPFDHLWKRFDPPNVFWMFQRGWKGGISKKWVKTCNSKFTKGFTKCFNPPNLLNLSSKNIDLEADYPTRKTGVFRARSNIYDGVYHENSWQFLVISISVWQCLKYASPKSSPVTGFSWFLLTTAVLIFKNEASMFPLAQKKSTY